MPPHRKCNHRDCPPENVNASTTVSCHSCKGEFHLPCFDVILPANKLFVIRNIVFVCDECLTSIESSPKRKQTVTLKQTLLSPMTTPTQTSSLRNSAKKSTANNDDLRVMMETIIRKIDVNSVTVGLLKNSVDSMHATVKTNATQIDDSFKKSDAEIGTATKTIVEQLEKFEKKQSYAQAVGIPSSNQIIRQMPSKSDQPNNNNVKASTKVAPEKKKISANKYKSCPLTSGTDTGTEHNLGAPVVIPERRKLTKRIESNGKLPARPKFKKSVYISRLEPSITVDGLKMFLGARMPDLNESDLDIRMLVKREQELSELSFISFCISCTDDLFSTLNSPSFWPAHIKMREFIHEPRKPRDNKTSKAATDGNSTSASIKSTPTIANANEDQPKNLEITQMQSPSAQTDKIDHMEHSQ